MLQKDIVKTIVFTQRDIIKTKKNLSILIASERKLKSISKYRLSRMTGVTESNITRVEQGDTNYTIEIFLSLCRALDIKSVPVE